jgi:hypothetical protein
MESRFLQSFAVEVEVSQHSARQGRRVRKLKREGGLGGCRHVPTGNHEMKESQEESQVIQPEEMSD